MKTLIKKDRKKTTSPIYGFEGGGWEGRWEDGNGEGPCEFTNMGTTQYCVSATAHECDVGDTRCN